MAATATLARSVVSQFVGTSVSSAAKTVTTRAVAFIPRHGVPSLRLAPQGLSFIELPFATGQLRPAILSRNFSEIKSAALDEEFGVETAPTEEAMEDFGAPSPPPPAAAPPAGTKLYVGNLPWSADSETLAEHFQQVGNVEMVEVIYDRETGRSRGFAFVTFSTQAEANAAIDQLDGRDLGGRALRVNYPNPAGTRTERAERPPRPAGMGAGAGGMGRRNDPNKLYVGNLSWGMDDLGLEELFAEFGAVNEARVVTDRETGRSRGFGFVTMATKDEVQAAIQALDGVDVDGRVIRVNLANEGGTAGGGGGGRGGGGGYGGGRREGGYGGGGGGGGGYGGGDGW